MGESLRDRSPAMSKAGRLIFVDAAFARTWLSLCMPRKQSDKVRTENKCCQGLKLEKKLASRYCRRPDE